MIIQENQSVLFYLVSTGKTSVDLQNTFEDLLSENDVENIENN